MMWLKVVVLVSLVLSFSFHKLKFFIVSDFHLYCQETKAKTKIDLMVPDEDTTEL